MKDTSSLFIRSHAPEIELHAKSLDLFTSRSVEPVSPGRSSLEERHWWNSEVRERYSRPGPGILPSMLPGVGKIVDGELFAIEVATPSPNLSSPSLSSERLLSSSPPPSDEEIRAAIPHPHAYYSPKHNSWILLSWGTSMEPPPMAPSFKQQDNVGAVFHREERRLLLNCTVFLQLNHTHHFHKFPSAVDPARLDPPYEPNDPRCDSKSSALPLDLYVCCQCQVYLIASSLSQPFVPEFLWNAFLEEERRLSTPETTYATTIVTSLKLLHTAIKNKLWRGEDRPLETTSLSFKRKLGSFTPITKEFFEYIGFSVCRIDEFEALVPGPTDVTSPEGLRNRAKMLRIWVELGAFLTYFVEKNAQSALLAFLLAESRGEVRQKLSLREGGVESEAPFWIHLTEYHQTESIPSVGLLQTTSFESSSLEDLTQGLAIFGFIPAHYSPSLLTFAYRAQCRCDPKNSVEYFSSLCEIENQLQMKGNDTSFLQTFIADERSRGRFTRDDIHEAVLILGLSDALHLFLSNDSSSSAPASDIVSKLTIGAWKSVYKKIAHLSEHEATEHAKHANEALRILSQVQGSEWLQGVWLTWKDRSVMTLEEAYDTLGTYESTGDDRIAELYRHEVHKSASFSERYALMVIAESRRSDSLRRLARIGGLDCDSERSLYQIVFGREALTAAEASLWNQTQASMLVSDLESILPFLQNSRVRRRILRLVRKLSSRHDILPASLQLHDVQVADHPFSGGGFSDVYEGNWNGERVCLKCLRVYANPGGKATDREEAEQAFRNEAFLWKQLNHPNIVPFLGVTYSALPNRMALVSSFMENGDIMKYVKGEAVPYLDRLRLILGIAEGLNYIHDLELCHHDIKGANILIDKDGNACLADLGIASVAQSQSETLNIVLTTTTSSGVKGSYRWMPPEIIHPDHFPSPPNSMTRDIYAFGCTMLEILTGKMPWYTERLDVTVMFKLFQQERPPRPSEGITDDVWNLIELCWHREPSERPSSSEVVLRLSKILETGSQA